MTPALLRQLRDNPLTAAPARAAAARILAEHGGAPINPVAKAPAPSPPAQSPLEDKFLELWTDLAGPPLHREFEFCPGRKFRFDFVHLPSMIVIETEGGGYSGKGRHFTPAGFEQDAVKYNLATLLGYRVFRLTGRMVCVEQIRPIVAACEGLIHRSSCGQ